ncbi:MAG: hypothetical protein WDW38_007525 [Sanguina aurantia]
MNFPASAGYNCLSAKNPSLAASSPWLRTSHICARPRSLHVVAQISGSQNSGSAGGADKLARNSLKGKNFSNTSRRKGREAHLRSPYDSPMRDGNRDRLIGLLTERAAKTLMVYLMETNVLLHNWLVQFYKDNPVPRIGSWDEVSGESFLRKLLAMPVSSAKLELGRDPLFDNSADGGVDPRSMAQRIMEIRSQLALEFAQDLKAVAEENSALLRESLLLSLTSASSDEDSPSVAPAPAAASGAAAGSAQRSSGSGSDGSDNELNAFRPASLQPVLPFKRPGQRSSSGRQAPDPAPDPDRAPGPPVADASRRKPTLAFPSKGPPKNWRLEALHSFSPRRCTPRPASCPAAAAAAAGTRGMRTRRTPRTPPPSPTPSPPPTPPPAAARPGAAKRVSASGSAGSGGGGDSPVGSSSSRARAAAAAEAAAAEVEKQMQAYLLTVHPEIAEMIRANVEGWQGQFPEIAKVLAQESAAATATASARFALTNMMNSMDSMDEGDGGVGVFGGGRSAAGEKKGPPGGLSIKSDLPGRGGADLDGAEEQKGEQRQSNEGQ